MKNVKVFAYAILILSVFTHCKQNSDGLISPTEEALIKKPWSVDYYFNNQDMTSDYSSSTLLFSSTGNVGYQKDGQTIAGKWSRAIDASNNETITLQFNSGDINIDRLNKSWKLTGQTDNALQFEKTDGSSQILFRLKAE